MEVLQPDLGAMETVSWGLTGYPPGMTSLWMEYQQLDKRRSLVVDKRYKGEMKPKS